MTTRVQGQEAHPDLVSADAREWLVVDGVGGCAHGPAAGWPLRRGHAWLHATGAHGEVITTLLGLEEAHRNLRISPAEFDEVAAELGRTLDEFQVPQAEKDQVLGAFAAHKGEVTEGYFAHNTAGA